MTITHNTHIALLKRIAFFMEMCIDPSINTQEHEIYTQKYYNTKNQKNITTQRKKVGKSTSPNRLNRSTHYIGQPRSTGGNH